MEEGKEEVQISTSEAESPPEETEEQSPVESAELKLRAIITEGALDFDRWTALIEVVEETYPDDIEKICLVYEPFLSEFPLCHGYWRRFADHKTRLCTIDKVVEVFEEAVHSATYSIDVWVDYCSFGISAFEDPCDVRRLFKRGLSFVGKDYFCHTLWDKFIEFELSQQQWSSLAHIYIQTLRFPTKKLHRYHESFKKFVSIFEEEMECLHDSSNVLPSELMHDHEVPTCYKDDEISSIIKNLLDPSIGLTRSHALSKYSSIGEHFYKTSCHLNEQISKFETRIRRSYFHAKPLDASQLENWHRYLDFVEAQGDFDWAVKLYERCLVPCCNYPEFWMRYVDFMETRGGREIANFALERATQSFLKQVPEIHRFNALFKEQIGFVSSARDAVLRCSAETDLDFVENVLRRANMEKRLGNYAEASNIYIEALEMAAAKENFQALPLLYVHFSRFKSITGNAEAARDTLIDGIKKVSRCKLLLEELIRFATIRGGAKEINTINSVMASSIYSEQEVSHGLSAEEREEISNLYLEFIDLCGTIHDVRIAWNRHIKSFPLSLRTPINFPTRDAPSNVSIEERKATFIAMLQQQASESCRDESMTLEENHPTQPNNDAFPVSDQNHDQIAFREADNDGAQQVSPEASRAPIGDHEPELDVKPLSLEGLSLDAKEHKFPTSIPTSYEYDQRQAASPSSSATHQIPRTYQQNSDRNYHQTRYDNRYRARDSKFGFRGHSQKRQQRHTPPMGAQIPVSQGGGHTGPIQYQAGVQNVAQPVGYAQYPMQGNDDQYGYDQMWQYYYYQQQQQQYYMQQQQQLQLQQQQELDPQQQQVLYQQQLQLQQQYLYQQQQQFQQLSEQQQQQFQQLSEQQQQFQQFSEQQFQQQPAQPQQFDSQQQLQQQQYLLYMQQLQQSQQNQQSQVEQHREEELEQPSQPPSQQQEQGHQNHHKIVSLQEHHDSSSIQEPKQPIAASSQSRRVTPPNDDTDTEISI